MEGRVVPFLLMILLILGCSGREETPPRKELSTAEKNLVREVRINHPPVIERLSIVPREPVATDRLRAVVSCRDPDGDRVYLRYTWRVNGEIAGQDEVLDEPLKKGDMVLIKVVCSDGKLSSELTDSVVVSNSPPVAKLAGQRMEGDVYRAEIEAEDPDGDPLSFRLVKGPPGMRIEGRGLLIWKVPKGVSGEFPVEVMVSDPDNASAIVSFSIRVRWEKSRVSH